MSDSDRPVIAFPVNDPEQKAYRQKVLKNYPTLRDSFAMSALTGLLQSLRQFNEPRDVVKEAYDIAEAMLEEKAKREA